MMDKWNAVSILNTRVDMSMCMIGIAVRKRARELNKIRSRRYSTHHVIVTAGYSHSHSYRYISY